MKITMFSAATLIIRIIPVFLLTACVSMPNGPSVMALPGQGKNFEQFSHDDTECRYFAYEQMDRATAKDAAVQSGFNSAAIGTALGALVGFVLGGAEGAAVGAGTGLLAGGLSGASNANAAGFIHQQRYDQSYTQCMYAKGHNVPVTGELRNYPPQNTVNRSSIPPPPPGYPSYPIYR